MIVLQPTTGSAKDTQSTIRFVSENRCVQHSQMKMPVMVSDGWHEVVDLRMVNKVQINNWANTIGGTAGLRLKIRQSIVVQAVPATELPTQRDCWNLWPSCDQVGIQTEALKHLRGRPSTLSLFSSKSPSKVQLGQVWAQVHPGDPAEHCKTVKHREWGFLPDSRPNPWYK